MADLAKNFEARTYSFSLYRDVLLPERARLLHWLGSVDYSGYTREKSLRYLIRYYQPGDENRILLRLADWVPKIQALAIQWTTKHFPTLSLEQINAQANLILYLSAQ